MPKEDRDPKKWRSRENTRVKHDILFEYLKGFIPILSAGNRGEPLSVLHYVDCHAGRGWYEGGEPGSPIVAMKVGQELHDYLGQYRADPVYLECYNVEYDRQNFDSLNSEIAAVRDRYPSVSVRSFFGPFQEQSEKILGLIEPGEPTFVLIDPFGYRGVELQEVLRFVQRPRSEVFITFMSDLIGRWMTDTHKAEGMRKVFDTEDWRTLIGLQGITQQKAAVDLYASQLMKKAREQGKRLYVFPINVAYEDRPGDIYHLVLVSQHPKARLVMEDAVTRVKGTSVEEQLFIAPEVEGYAVEALRNSKVRRMTALDLAGEVWQKSLYASWRTDHRWSEPLTEARLRYASDDVEHLETLYHDLLSKVEEDGMMEAYEVVRSVYPVYMRQQARGVPFDAELYERMRARLKEKLDTQLREHAPDHPDEGGRWVWRNNRKPEEREGRNGALRALALAGTPLKDRKKSTRLAYLKKYENAPFLEALDQYLRHADLEGNTRGWMDLYHEDGRLYPNVKFFSQVTGRSAYADPALQNIAKSLDLPGMEGTSFRDCIRAPEGSSIVKADYSAQELRILAHVAGDEDLLNALVAQAAGGKDPHLVVGEKIAGKELKKGTPEGRTYRQAGKRANYGFSYGAGWKRYQRTVYEDTAEVITDLQAKQEKWAFEEAWPGVATWQQAFGDRAGHEPEAWFTRTFLNRRRYVSPGKEGKPNYCDRLNGPVQSGGADQLYLALAKMVEDPFEGAHVIVTTHDEIVLECPEEVADEALRWLLGHMREAVKETIGDELATPDCVEGEAGRTWGS